jgi:hypothetical protein
METDKQDNTPAQGVKMDGLVKPLVWRAVSSEDALCHDHWVAPALGGAFHIAPDEDSAAGAWLLQWTICHEDFCMAYGGAISNHVDAEAAKAAAQADYTACILSALDLDAIAALVGAAKHLATWDHCWPGNINLERAVFDLRTALARLGVTE